MPGDLYVPILDDLAPQGFVYGGHYVVEFDSDSLWYETSLTIAALALKRGIKTEYHVFQHFPSEAKEAFSRLGIDSDRMEEEGLLSIWDSYTATAKYEEDKEKIEKEKGNLWESDLVKPLNAEKSAKGWTEAFNKGYSEEEKHWLHIDDNTSIFLQYNDEKVFTDAWRTAIVPFAMRGKESPHFIALVKGVASDAFYTKFEALGDGIIDLKAQEEGGRIEQYIRIRMLRGKRFDSRWHRLELMENGQVALEVARAEEARRLAAIMFTDMVGYTAMTQKNESRAIDLLKRHRDLLRPVIIRSGGSEVKTIGDAFLVEFSSALAAAECAAEMQNAVREYNSEYSESLQVRIGIHVGDVIHEGGDVYGDAVNIASRIEPLAPAGGICITQQVYDQIANKVPYRFTKLEPRELKNVSTPIGIYRMEQL